MTEILVNYCHTLFRTRSS